MCSKNKPPKQNTMRKKWERAGMCSKNKPPKQNTMRNQEKEGMKEERENKSTKRKKRTFFEIFFS
jgi:hypothetical protein